VGSILTQPEDVALDNLLLPQPHQLISPEQACELALVIGLKGLGYVSPNPLVGAVIVDNAHRFISCGSHLRLGSEHAEVNAVNQAKSQGHSIKGAKMYVSLEPCSHQGLTPSCAKFLASLGLSELSYAVLDPNPLVSGSGVAILERSQVKVSVWPCYVKEAKRLAEVFLYNQARQELFVAAKIASDLDGNYAAKGDRRAFITGPRARAYGHYLRQRYDAIAVGSETFLLDNPSLTPRDTTFKPRAPWRVILDGSGRALEALAQKAAEGSEPEILKHDSRLSWVISPEVSLSKHAAAYCQSRQFSLLRATDERELLSKLWKLGLRSLLLEGGGGVWERFSKAGVIAKWYHFQAQHLLSGASLQSSKQTLGALKEGASLVRHYELGEDQFFEYDCRS